MGQIQIEKPRIEFSTFFGFETHFPCFKTIWRYPYLQLASKKMSSSGLEENPRVFHGTQGFRGIPVENRWKRWFN
jgi:hypothetical protein